MLYIRYDERMLTSARKVTSSWVSLLHRMKTKINEYKKADELANPINSPVILEGSLGFSTVGREGETRSLVTAKKQGVRNAFLCS